LTQRVDPQQANKNDTKDELKKFSWYNYAADALYLTIFLKFERGRSWSG